MSKEGSEYNKAHGGMTYLHGLLAIAGTMVVVTDVVAMSDLALSGGVGDGNGDGKTVEDDSHATEALVWTVRVQKKRDDDFAGDSPSTDHGGGANSLTRFLFSAPR